MEKTTVGAQDFIRGKWWLGCWVFPFPFYLYLGQWQWSVVDVPGPEQAASSSSSCTAGLWLTPFSTNFGMVLKIYSSPGWKGCVDTNIAIYSFQWFLTDREMPGLGKQQRSAGFSHPDNPHCWVEGRNLMFCKLACPVAVSRALACWRSHCQLQ